MWKGKVYGLPFPANIFRIFYNLDRLDEVGAAIPKTLEDFNVLARTLPKEDPSGEFIRGGL